MNRNPLSSLPWLACLALFAGCGVGQGASPGAAIPPAARTTALATPYAGPSRPVIIDTDMAADDWMAILYLLRRPDIQVKAITVTGTGLAHCGPGVRNALGLLSLSGYGEVPVACGREVPLAGDHAFPPEWRQGADNLFGAKLPEGGEPVSGKKVADLLAGTVRESPAKVPLLALGPLTNVAEALHLNPSLANKLEAVYIMGGAVDVPGNIASSGVGIDNAVAEWNIYIDPRAANTVLKSGAPITLIPLDATNYVPLNKEFYERIEQNHPSPEAGFAFEVLKNLDTDGYYLWDPLAAAILTNETLARFATKNLTVVEAGGPESGRTKISPGGPAVRVALSADAPRFEQLFLNTLNNRAR